MKAPKVYRKEIYNYVEELLGRPLTIQEHDELRERMVEYVFSTRNLRATFRRVVCHHEWVSDRMIEGGQNARVYVKCIKCDKHTQKKMPAISMDVS